MDMAHLASMLLGGGANQGSVVVFLLVSWLIFDLFVSCILKCVLVVPWCPLLSSPLVTLGLCLIMYWRLMPSIPGYAGISVVRWSSSSFVRHQRRTLEQ
jgi:hypothetical protein